MMLFAYRLLLLGLLPAFISSQLTSYITDFTKDHYRNIANNALTDLDKTHDTIYGAVLASSLGMKTENRWCSSIAEEMQRSEAEDKMHLSTAALVVGCDIQTSAALKSTISASLESSDLETLSSAVRAASLLKIAIPSLSKLLTKVLSFVDSTGLAVSKAGDKDENATLENALIVADLLEPLTAIIVDQAHSEHEPKLTVMVSTIADMLAPLSIPGADNEDSDLGGKDGAEGASSAPSRSSRIYGAVAPYTKKWRANTRDVRDIAKELLLLQYASSPAEAFQVLKSATALEGLSTAPVAIYIENAVVDLSSSSSSAPPTVKVVGLAGKVMQANRVLVRAVSGGTVVGVPGDNAQSGGAGQAFDLKASGLELEEHGYAVLGSNSAFPLDKIVGVARPGTYTVKLAVEVDGRTTPVVVSRKVTGTIRARLAPLAGSRAAANVAFAVRGRGSGSAGETYNIVAGPTSGSGLPAGTTATAGEVIDFSFSVESDGNGSGSGSERLPLRPHQVFVRLEHVSTGSSYHFPVDCSDEERFDENGLAIKSDDTDDLDGSTSAGGLLGTETGRYESSINLDRVTSVLQHRSGHYRASILVGDPHLSGGGAEFVVGSIEIALPRQVTKNPPLYARPLSYETEMAKAPLPRLDHMFRPPARRASALITLAVMAALAACFAGFALAVVAIVFGGAKRGGGNGQSRSGKAFLIPPGLGFIYTVGFFASLGGVLSLYAVYWLALTLNQCLYYSTPLFCLTLFFGHKALSARAMLEEGGATPPATLGAGAAVAGGSGNAKMD